MQRKQKVRQDDFDRVLAGLEARVDGFAPNPRRRWDVLMYIAVQEALKAAKEGNFGFGAVLVDSQWNVLEKGHNQFLYSGRGKLRLRSNLHAEMVVIDKSELRRKGDHRMHRGNTVVCSGQHCPMCMSRMIVAGVSGLYAAIDEGGGMNMSQMPPVFQNIAKGAGLTYELADCDPALSTLAQDIFLASIPRIDALLSSK